MGRKAAKQRKAKPKKAVTHSVRVTKAKEKAIGKPEPKRPRTKGNGGSTGYGTFVNVTLPPLMAAAGREGPKQKYESVAMEICMDCMDGRYAGCGDNGKNVYVLAQQVYSFLMMRHQQRENGETTQLTPTQKGLVDHLAKALRSCFVTQGLANEPYPCTQLQERGAEFEHGPKTECGAKPEDGPMPELPDLCAPLEPNSLKVDLESKLEMDCCEPIVKTEGIKEEVGIMKEEVVMKEEIVKQEMDELPPKEQGYCPIEAMLDMFA